MEAWVTLLNSGHLTRSEAHDKKRNDNPYYPNLKCAEHYGLPKKWKCNRSGANLKLIDAVTPTAPASPPGRSAKEATMLIDQIRAALDFAGLPEPTRHTRFLLGTCAGHAVTLLEEHYGLTRGRCRECHSYKCRRVQPNAWRSRR